MELDWEFDIVDCEVAAICRLDWNGTERVGKELMISPAFEMASKIITVMNCFSSRCHGI